MSSFISNNSAKDEIRIGDCAAKQPLSGTSVVTRSFIKGATATTFVRLQEIKKAS
jgi:hypothetical protein